MSGEQDRITPEMTVLDVVSKWEACQAVFRGHDGEAGECILCQALFERIEDVASRYGLNLAGLLAELNRAAHN